MDFDKLIPCRVFNLIHRFLKHFPLLKRIKTISFYLHVNLNLPGECHNLRLRVVQCMLRKTDEFRSKVLLIDYVYTAKKIIKPTKNKLENWIFAFLSCSGIFSSWKRFQNRFYKVVSCEMYFNRLRVITVFV